MKLGWVSVSWNARTGYGRISREICTRLEGKHDLTYFGNEGEVSVWGGTTSHGKIKIFGYTQPEAAGVIKPTAIRYGLSYLVAHWDAFVLGFLKDLEIPYALYAPVDAELTQKWVNYMDGAHRMVAYSLFGYEQLKKHFPTERLWYIPHGVDTSVFKPIEVDRHERTRLPSANTIPEDCFLFVSTQANVGARKHIPLLLRTFKRFADSHPDAHFFMWTNAWSEVPYGFDLPALVEELGLTKKIHWPKYNPINEPATDEQLNRLYNLGDAYLTNSLGEGFGLPVLEAQAAGLPIIAPDNSAHRELIAGHGWLVKGLDQEEYVDYPNYVPTLQTFQVPNQRDLLNCMEEAYFDAKKRKRFSEDSRRFAEGYDWSKIMPRWEAFLKEVEEEQQLWTEVRDVLRPSNSRASELRG